MERLIVETLRIFGIGGAQLAASFVICWWFFSDLHKQQGRGWWIARLRHDGFGRRYRELMDGALDRLDGRLSPEADESPGAPKTDAARAWSHGLLDLCLLLAVAYPLLSLLAYWAATGEAGRIGPLVALPPEPERWKRAVTVGAVALMATVAQLSSRDLTPRQRLCAGGLMMIAFVFVFAVAGGFVGASAFAVAFVVGGASASPAAIVGAFSGSFVAAVASAFAIAGAIAVAVAVTSVAADEVVVLGAVFGAFSGIAIVAVAGAVATNWMGRRRGKPALAPASFAALLWVALAGATGLAPEIPGGARTLLLFLGFLPLLNAAADFASVGLTRWLLRRGVRGNFVANAALDALGAVAVLLALGFALIATVHIARPAGGAPLIDLAALFADLRDPVAVHDYYWLYFCFFSTLLPTALHLMVACFGLFTLASKWLGQPIAAWVASPIETEQRAASLAFTACAALAVWIPVMALWQGLAWFGRPALDGLLWAFEGFARLIGAV